MCGGGGGGQTVAAPDPMKEAEAQIKQLQAQYALDQKSAVAAAQRAADKEAADRAQWSTDLGGARNQALKSVQSLFKTKGVDASNYMDRINAALDLEQGSKSFGGDTGFSKTLGTGILDDIRGSTIRDYQSAIDKFAPAGYQDTAFASTADDAIIEAILGEQFGEASDSILRARDRGTLNDVGYDYAMKNLGSQRTAANARLQEMGGGILGGYRDQLSSIINNAKTAAGSWDFGQKFDPTTYSKQLTSKQGDLSGGLEGALRNAVGGEQFFNIADLIQKGGVGQGAQNTGLGGQSGSLLSAIKDRKKDEEAERGLGTQGSF